MLQEVSQKSIMPWVTVCNESPLSDDVYPNLNWRKFFVYTDLAKKLMAAAPQSILNVFNMSAEEALTLFTWSETQFGYIANLPLPLTPMGSYNYNDSRTSFIVDCNYFDSQLETFEDGEINCRDTIHSVYNWLFYRCFSFRPPANVTPNIRGLTAIFYLDDFTSTNNNYFNTDVKLSQSSGIRLSVHASGTGSDVEVGEGIGPGTENLVHVMQTNHIRLPDPYGTCTDRLHLDSPNIQEGDDVYTIDTCYGLCMQQLMVDQCRCLDTEFPFNESHLKLPVHPKFCINGSFLENDKNVLLKMEHAVDVLGESELKQILEAEFRANPGIAIPTKDTLERILCMLNLRLTFPQKIGSCHCPKPCTEYTYKGSAAGAPWPHRSYQLAFYNKYIAPHPEIYGSRFDVYAEIQVDARNLSDADIIRRLDATKLIRKNFVRVDVLFDWQLSLEFEETPSITVDAMPANFGGALSLYLDISLIFVIELVDLLYNIFHNVLWSIYSRKKTSPSSTTRDN